MHLPLRKDRVLGVHKFVQKNTQRVGIEVWFMRLRTCLPSGMVKVGYIGSFLQSLLYFDVEWDGLSYFGYSILNVDVFDVQHVEGFDGGLLHEF